MNALKLALQFMRREWRSGELTTLTASLILAITSVLTITLITDRLSTGMTRQSSELIGGDLVIASTREPDLQWQEISHSLGIQSTTTVLFDSVIFANEEMQLSGIKAVGDSYPLLGELEVKDNSGPAQKTVDIPAPGAAWADARLLDLLKINLGDDIIFGATTLTVEKLLVFEPDQAGSLFQFAPRLMVNRADLKPAQVLGPGSRVRYRTMFSGQRIDDLRTQLTPNLGIGHRIITPNEEDNRASAALSKATQYIRLATLLTLILAAIAIALTARRYAERHRDTSAMLRCLGGQQSAISLLFIYQLTFITACSIAISAFAGWTLHELILQILKPLLPVQLPPPSPTPWVIACASAVLLMTGFALPPLLRLSTTPPLRVLRKEMGPPSLSMWVTYGLTGGSQLLLLLVIFNDISQVLLALLLATLSIGLLGLLIYRTLRRLNRGSGKKQALVARSVRNLAAHPVTSTSQIMAFSLTILLMLLLANLRTDLLAEWRVQLPVDAPNHFAFNLFPHQQADFVKTVSAQAELQPLFPLIRGRMVAINGSEQAVIAGGDNRRELSLTWASELPKDNLVTGGTWPPRSGEISVEQEYAQRLGLNLGDTIQVDVSGSVFEVTVSSLRSVEWESFSPNFYLILAREQLEDKPTTYLTSFNKVGDNRNLLRTLNAQFPSLTIIEMDNMLSRMEGILAQVSLSVELVLIFILLGGFAVLFATLQTTADERLREGALLRALGAGRNYVRKAYLMEFGLIGLLSGLIAVTGAEIATAMIYQLVFQLEFSPSPLLWVTVPVAMALVVAVAGYAGSRKIMKVSPNQLLLND